MDINLVHDVTLLYTCGSCKLPQVRLVNPTSLVLDLAFKVHVFNDIMVSNIGDILFHWYPLGHRNLVNGGILRNNLICILHDSCDAYSSRPTRMSSVQRLPNLSPEA